MEIVPDLLKQAMIRHREGDLPGARRLYLDYLELATDDADAWCLLGALDGQNGDHEGAEAAYRRAMSNSPGHAQAHAGLGTSLLMQDRLREAVDALSTAVELAPEEPETRMQLAVAQLRIADTAVAAKTLAELIERWPDHLRGRYTLGAALMRLGLPDQAAGHFQAIVAQQGGQSPAALALVRALLTGNDLRNAEAALEEVILLQGAGHEAQILLGDLNRARGRFEEAAAAYQDALSIRPDASAALLGLAEIDRRSRRFTQGLERIAPLLSLEPPSSRACLMTGRLLLDAGRYREAIGRIDEWIQAPGILMSVRRSLLSLRGRALDELGEHAAAWADWTESHGDQSGEFEGRQFRAVIDALRDTFDARLFDRLGQGGGGWEGPRPLLVVGAPSSGKSILEQILACHPVVRGAGELRELGAMTNRISGLAGSARPYPFAVRDLSREMIEALAAGYTASMKEFGEGASWVIDTQPTNFLHIGLIALLVPDARVIVCIRDPLDTAWACYRRRFADRGLSFAASAEGIAQYLAGMRALLEHWEAVCPNRIMTVRYEDLVRSPIKTAGEVLRYMGLDQHEECSNYATPGVAKLATAPVLNRPINDAEIGRGEPYRENFAIVQHGVVDGKDGY